MFILKEKILYRSHKIKKKLSMLRADGFCSTNKSNWKQKARFRRENHANQKKVQQHLHSLELYVA